MKSVHKHLKLYENWLHIRKLEVLKYRSSVLKYLYCTMLVYNFFVLVGHYGSCQNFSQLPIILYGHSIFRSHLKGFRRSIAKRPNRKIEVTGTFLLNA